MLDKMAFLSSNEGIQCTVGLAQIFIIKTPTVQKREPPAKTRASGK